MEREAISEKCEELFRKLSDFVDEPDFDEQAYIAGGCIRSIMLYEKIKDVDLFLREGWMGNRLRRKYKYSEGIYMSKNAISISIDGVKFQIVTTVFGEPSEVMGEFDFKMNMNYYDPEFDELYIESERDIYSRTLEINPNCRNKLGTLARIAKFAKRGYQMPTKVSLLQLACQISALEEVTTFEELVSHSKLYFSSDEYKAIDFVEKPLSYEGGDGGSFRGSAV